MLKDDDSRVSLRELSRWLVMLLMIVAGITLFFLLGKKIRPIAAPIHVESGLQ